MNARRLTPLLVACGMFGLYLVMVVIDAVKYRYGVDWFFIGAVGLLLAQWSMLAGWLALGDWPMAARVAAALFAVFALPCVLFFGRVPVEESLILFLFSMGYFTFAAAPLALLNLARFRCRCDAYDAARFVIPRQFAIRHILIFTVVVAVVMAILRYVRLPVDPGFKHMLVLCLLAVAITWIAFPVILRLPLVLGLIALGSFAWLLGYLVFDVRILPRYVPPRETFAFYVAHTLILGAALTVLRLAGYQLVRDDEEPRRALLMQQR